ncbi:MAG: tetratricopeptide repeat protein, partial [Blastocatellia bacterium]
FPAGYSRRYRSGYRIAALRANTEVAHTRKPQYAQAPASRKKSPASATPAQIENTLKTAQAQAPDDFTTNQRLGAFYLQQGKLTAAIPYLERARRIDPSHYNNGFDLALALAQTGAHAPARTIIQQLLSVRETAELHNLLGEIEEKAGNGQAAAAAYYRAAQLDPAETNLLDLGNILIRLSAFDEAEKIIRYGLEKYPRSARLQIGMGILYYSRGQYPEAIRTLCQASDLDPADARPYLFLGEMWGVDAGLADEVTRRMERFTRLHPREAKAHFYYAMSQWKGKGTPDPKANLALIETLLQKALRLDPALADAHYELGFLYSDQNRNTLAVQSLRRAITLRPEMEKAHYRLAQLYQRTGQPDLAAREMEIYQKLKKQ